MKLEFNRKELIIAAGERSRLDPDNFGLTIDCDEINVEKIGLIGIQAGLRDDGLLHNSLDRQLLRSVICSAEVSSNINLSPSLKGEIINADQLYGGIDYFNLSGQYDLLVLGNIYLPHNPTKMLSGAWGIGGPDCYVSPLCDHVKGWPEQAEKLSAKAIFTASYGASLDVNYFETFGNYSVIQHETYDNGHMGIAIHKSKVRLVA